MTWTDAHTSHLIQWHESMQDVRDALREAAAHEAWLVEHLPLQITGPALIFKEHADSDMRKCKECADHIDQDADRFAQLVGMGQDVVAWVKRRIAEKRAA